MDSPMGAPCINKARPNPLIMLLDSHTNLWQKQRLLQSTIWIKHAPPTEGS